MDLLISLLCLCFSSEDEEATLLLVWHRSWVEPSHSTGGNSLHSNLIQTGWKFSVLCIPVSPLSPLPPPPFPGCSFGGKVLEEEIWCSGFRIQKVEVLHWEESKCSSGMLVCKVCARFSFTIYISFGVCRKGSLILPWLRFKREPLRYL